MNQLNFSNPSYTIHNICGRFTLAISSLDLSYLAVKMHNTSYNRKRLPGIVIRKRKPRATVILFASGKGLVIGLEEAENL